MLTDNTLHFSTSF